jgi:DDE superfamily endonuclease
MTRTEVPVVRKQVVVNAPVEQAFTAFIERFGDFKPPEHNLLAAAIAGTVFEPHVGGHIYDRAVDGSECRWARILAYEPPARVVFSWLVFPSFVVSEGRRACWFFAAANWDPGALGLAVARLVVKYLLAGGEPLTVAVDGTFFRRRGRNVAEARWAYDGAAQGGKKIASGNT